MFGRKVNKFRMDKEFKRHIQNEINADQFYSESNMAHLRRGITALNDGKGVEHEPVEEEKTKDD